MKFSYTNLALASLALLVSLNATTATATAQTYRYAQTPCATGNCPRPVTVPTQQVWTTPLSAPAPAGVPAGYYYLADRAGQVWYAAERSWVETQVARVNAATIPAVVAPTLSAPTYDPLAEVNAARSRLGLHALIHDPVLSQWAQANNAEQSRLRRLGHHVNNGYGQCSGWNYRSAAHAVAGWSGSAAHAAILYSSSYRYAGMAINGVYCTLNCR